MQAYCVEENLIEDDECTAVTRGRCAGMRTMEASGVVPVELCLHLREVGTVAAAVDLPLVHVRL